MHHGIGQSLAAMQLNSSKLAYPLSVHASARSMPCGDGGLFERTSPGQKRALGYEVRRDELIKDAVAVAASFFLGDDRVLASIAVFGRGARVDDAHVKRFAELLRSEANKLPQALGQK